MQYASSRRGAVFQNKEMPVPSLILFLRQLSVLADGTIALDDALQIIAESGANRTVREAGSELCAQTKNGALLSDAMRAGGRFSAILVAMVQTGEESGSLGRILSNYTEALQRQETTRRKVQQALIYPIVLTVVSVSVVTFLLFFVIPSFVALFSDAGMQLPLPTRILLAISATLSGLGPLLLIPPVLLLLAVLVLSRTESGRLFLHKIKRRVPFFGNLDRDIHTARIAELMALFFAGNVDLVRFLQILAEGTKNPAEKHALQSVHQSILAGRPVSEAFQEAAFYNPVFTGMVRIGEESGRLSEVTDSIASYLDLEVQLRLGRATALLEPVLILLLSFLVGFIVLAIAMPMFQMVHLYDF